MSFIIHDPGVAERVTPEHSAARGRLVTGERLEVGVLSFRQGEGAETHHHDQEQIVVVVSGSLRVRLGSQSADLGPGDSFHAPSGTPHGVTALTDCQVVSCKDLAKGRGHASR